MRPGNRWHGEAINPLAAAVYGAVVSVVAAFALFYLFGRLGSGVICASYAWDSPRALQLAGLALYASQHVPLAGSGALPGQSGAVQASVTFPLTFWALIPAISLMLGGYLAARVRNQSGRWGMIGPAIAGGILYAAILTALTGVVSARFTSAALPSFNGIEFNPPDLPFHPMLWATPYCCGIFAVVSSYLGALLAVRSSRASAIPGKWWACAKAVVVTGLVVQLLFVCAGLALFTRSEDAQENAEWKFAQVLPTVTGMGYTLAYGADLSYSAVPIAMPKAGYSGSIHLYRGILSNDRGETTRKRPSGYVWIAAALAALVAFSAGRLSVKWGSRDGSLPTSVRIVILQAVHVALLVWLCGMGWSIAGQFTADVQLRYNAAMLLAGIGVFVMALIGAHWANRRYAGRLTGFPKA